MMGREGLPLILWFGTRGHLGKRVRLILGLMSIMLLCLGHVVSCMGLGCKFTVVAVLVLMLLPGPLVLAFLLRHEQQSIRMALTTFTHHSAAPEDGQGQGSGAGGELRAKATGPATPPGSSHGLLRGCRGSSPRGVVASWRRRR